MRNLALPQIRFRLAWRVGWSQPIQAYQGGAFPGAGGEGEGGEGAGGGGGGEVADLGSCERGVAEVVVVADELVPLPGSPLVADDGDGDLAEVADGGGGVSWQRKGELPCGAVAPVAAVAVAVTGWRQGDQLVGVHPAEGDAGGHVFPRAVGAVPGQGVADRVGDRPAGRQRCRQGADLLQLGRGEVPAAVAGAKMAGLNPRAYLDAYLDACAANNGKPPAGLALEALLPWNISLPEDPGRPP